MDINRIELFERHSDGDLSPEELIAFNKELQNNPEFLKDFKIFNDINFFLANKAVINANRFMQEAYAENIANKKTKKISLYRISSIAASLLVLITIGVYFWISPNNNSKKEQIFSTFYADMPYLQNSTDSVSLYSIALDAYNARDFKKAESILNQLCYKDSTNPLYKFNMALVYLATAKYKDSENLLIKLRNEKIKFIEDNSVWFLGVIYYKTKNFDKAGDLFRLISNKKEHFKSEDAKIALEIIEEDLNHKK